MEEESFEDEEIAAYMNRHYVAIKVDREERPDIDALYMNAVMAITGRGGWPMTVWLTPEGKPIYGGTYFPARDGDRGGATGFLSLLKTVHEVYQTQPDRVAEAGRAITGALEKLAALEGGDDIPSAAVLHQAAAYYKERYDTEYGGLRGTPKCPSSLPLRFLLRYHRRTGEDAYLEMARNTLEKMAAGGLYDQVGGGFHRYSTDAEWRVPHFEKMLYDNALLVPAYLEAYQVTGNSAFRRTAEEVLAYVSREMTSPAGAFYSDTDADSMTPMGHREEGYYFTWMLEELKRILGDARAALVVPHYGVTLQGNFEGRNILYTPLTLSESAKLLDRPEDQLRSAIEASHQLHWLETALALERTVRNLFEDRDRGGYFATGSEHERLLVRQKPHSDGAIPSGNSTMILNLLRLAEITFQKTYRQRAVTALTFFSKTLETRPAALSPRIMAASARASSAGRASTGTSRTSPRAPFVVGFSKLSRQGLESRSSLR